MRIGSTLLIQASQNTCLSGGGTWDPVENVCVEAAMPMPLENANDIYGAGLVAATASSTIIPGVSDTVVYIAGAIALYFLLRHHQ